MYKLRLKLALAAVVVIGLMSLSTTAYAATPNFNLTTSPVFVTLNTAPGTTVTTDVKVQNNSQQAADLTVSLMKFKAYGDSGQSQLFTPEKNDTSVKWVSFSQTEIHALPQAWNTITMTIKPPATAAFGYYYAVVFTPKGTSPAQAPNINGVNGSSAVPVLLDVKVPGEKRQLDATSFKSQHRVYEFLPATFTVTLNNTGDIYTAPKGDVYISKDKTTTLATLPINPAANNILPKSTRTFSVQWDDGFPAHVVKKVDGQVVNDKNGKPATELSFDSSKLNKFRFGKYYAHMLLVYDNGTQDVPIEAEVSFWVIPWKILSVIVIIGLLILFALYTLIKRVVKATKRAVKKPEPKTKA